MKPIHISLLLSLIINLWTLSVIPKMTDYVKKNEAMPIAVELIKMEKVSVTPHTNFIIAPKKTVPKTSDPANAMPEEKTVSASLKNIETIKPMPQEPVVQERSIQAPASQEFTAQPAPSASYNATKDENVTLPTQESAVVENVESALQEPIMNEEAASATTQVQPSQSLQDIGAFTDDQNEEQLLADAPPEETAPISRLTKAPSAKDGIAPIYPENARKLNKEGLVQIQALIDFTGSVIEAKITKSAGFGFDEAAVDAVRQANFEPAMMNEKPVTVRVIIPIEFKLE